MTVSNMNMVVLSQTSIGGSGNDLGFTNPVTVTIATTEDEENLTKPLKVNTFALTSEKKEKDTNSEDYGSKDSKILDLIRAEKRITIDGWLVNDVIGDYSNDSNSLAEDKKSDLKKIFLGGGVINMLYEGEVFTVNMDKLSIKRERHDGLTGDDGIGEFSIKLTAIKGINLIGN